MMKHGHRFLLAILAVTAASVLGGATSAAAQNPREEPDVLYVGDSLPSQLGELNRDTVQHFDARTGRSLGTFITGLQGPHGILHTRQGFLVSNQNVFQPFAGEIDHYTAAGTPLAPLVSRDDRNAPFAPNGIIVGPDRRTLYVADVGPDCPPTGPCTVHGAVRRYDLISGRFLGDLDLTSFLKPNEEFRPRGLVFDSGQRLYVSVAEQSARSVGVVLSVHLGNGRITVVADNRTATDACGQHLHRPDGLVFGPDERLYVTSFQADANDIDRILIFDPEHGKCVDEIGLDQVGQPRAFAQALLFGPGRDLFVPISNNGPDSGAVRRYNVKSKTFTNFVAPNAQGGPLGSPQYLTFGKTDPTTLAYPD
jgi:sugar lactone lactonase YvrE